MSATRPGSEEDFSDLFENSLTGVCIIRKGRVVYANKEYQRHFGHLPANLKKGILAYIHPEDAAGVSLRCDDLLMEKVTAVDGELRIFSAPTTRGPDKHEDLDIQWIRYRASRVRYRGEKAILVNAMDITGLKEMEQAAAISTKMHSLGYVATGIVHEIKNPMTGINAYLYRLKTLCDTGRFRSQNSRDVKEITGKMQGALSKIEAVIKRALDFSKPGPLNMDLVDINHPIEAAVDLSRAVLRKRGIHIEKHLNNDLTPCYADTILIEQVVLNLIDNAAKAMQGQTPTPESRRKRLAIHSFQENDRIIFHISDSGPGVPPQLKRKIFRPFFSTWEEGSGIGLSIARRIVTDHHGSIHVEDSLWGGAKFIVELPVDKRKS